MPIHLRFQDQDFELFPNETATLAKCFFDSFYAPISIEFSKEAHETFADILQVSPFFYTLLELRELLEPELLEPESSEVSTQSEFVLDFPQLNLFNLHQDLPLFKQLSPSEFIKFLSGLRKMNKEPDNGVLDIVLKKQPSFKERINYLYSISEEGGAGNPILIDDSSDSNELEDGFSEDVGSAGGQELTTHLYDPGAEDELFDEGDGSDVEELAETLGQQPEPAAENEATEGEPSGSLDKGVVVEEDDLFPEDDLDDSSTTAAEKLALPIQSGLSEELLDDTLLGEAAAELDSEHNEGDSLKRGSVFDFD
ncbi:hypothetical protein HDU91_001723, partial [Kappamyces sp. JEL0680]